MSDTLLVELLTEELPPKALKHLGEAFAHGLTNALVRVSYLRNARHR
jgi:glycyl-tRNA synthetase beta chain